ncbi:hypothetical protein Pcinc_027556 [Petrolisthes cinctipes]|uniref:Uncharacterized protein n=1 Tax=Petrolisthes cinctipes TaxID=88211 RepID=A0AAE1F4N1_PETCI|nr:hypothetical protein Pcinc_027556 [Petrolisthes cinctipes]
MVVTREEEQEENGNEKEVKEKMVCIVLILTALSKSTANPLLLHSFPRKNMIPLDEEEKEEEEKVKEKVKQVVAVDFHTYYTSTPATPLTSTSMNTSHLLPPSLFLPFHTTVTTHPGPFTMKKINNELHLRCHFQFLLSVVITRAFQPFGHLPWSPSSNLPLMPI